MAITIPSGNTQFLIEDDDKTYVLNAGSTRSATGTDSAIMVASGYHNDKIILKGDVSQTDMATFAVSISGVDMVLNIAATGSVLGNSGVEFTGARAILHNAGLVRSTDDFGFGLLYQGLNNDIFNSGVIRATGLDASAIFATGQNSTIHNDGKLQGAFGINISDARTIIDLGTHSNVIGSTAGLYSENTEATDRVIVDNAGKITGLGGAFAIELGDSDDSITNHGSIVGRIQLGTGKDLFDNRGGSVDHAIFSGAGDDTLVTDDASVKLKENGGSEGYDTVRSTVGYTLSDNVERLILIGGADINGAGTSGGDDLFGNSGRNHLFGFDGVDGLDGDAGNDILTGGAKADIFVFGTGYDHDRITDFGKGNDRIDVSHWTGINNFADVKQHWSASGGDLFITVGGDELTLLNTDKTDLQAGDFIF